jgi:ADP-ribosyl-[dinitrogen reductase] hydrolase
MAKSRNKLDQNNPPEVYQPTPIDRYRGSLVGLAMGDALGTTLEFTKPGGFKPIADIVGGGPFNLKPGEWTDDTSMALCLAESFIIQRTFDPVDQMQRYLKCYKEGHLSANGRCFDIGITIREALRKFEKSGDPYSGSTDPRSAANGSIMRLAPVPFFYAEHPAEAILKSGLSSRTTHQLPVTIDACRYLGALIVGAVLGASKEDLPGERYRPVSGYWQENPLVPEIDAVASGSFKRLDPPEIRGRTYVAKSLEAALWAFHRSNSFRQGCLKAVNLGEDADTTGVDYGQIAGAFYGYRGIPARWREKIALRELIESMAESIFELSRSIRR